MSLATDKRLLNPPSGTTADHLIAKREIVLKIWLDRVRKYIPAEKNEQEPILVNTLPALLENLAEALTPNYPREVASEGSSIASEHGGERARITRIAPSDLIKEYQLLRDVLFEVLAAEGPLDQRDFRVIIKSIDQAMTESLTAFFLVQEGIREQFTAMLTHDLRSPLSAIKVSIDMILKYQDRSEMIPNLARRVAQNVRRIDQMIQDLLDASRIRFGERTRYEVTQFELLSLVQEILSELKMIHGDRFVLQGEPIIGIWNRDAFKRAMENLLINAIKYGDKNTPITVKLEALFGRVIFSVRNEGPHIPAEEQEGIFKSFMRAGETNTLEKRGWGLGLAMVREMAEGHGGSITVDSAEDRGTTFVIDVPIDSRPFLDKPLTPGTQHKT